MLIQTAGVQEPLVFLETLIHYLGGVVKKVTTLELSRLNCQ